MNDDLDDGPMQPDVKLHSRAVCISTQFLSICFLN
jgi:hypothetical protein